jgi:NitT/TauT family transport system permease protein
MSADPSSPSPGVRAASKAIARTRFAPLLPWVRTVRTIRDAPGYIEGLACGLLCVGLVLLAWWFLTRGEVSERILTPYTLPSLPETLGSFRSLWFERELSLSAVISLARVLGGFVISAAIGVPLGVIAGSYLRVNAFLKPISLFGRNIPIAALIPLTLIWFGIDEVQKVMFIFLASVAFVLFDTTGAVQAVPDRYLDTGHTLGARRTPRTGAILAAWVALGYGLAAAVGWYFLEGGAAAGTTAEFVPGETASPGLAAEVRSAGFWWRLSGGCVLGFALWFPILGHQTLRKVVLPLSLPDIVNSLRLLFGLAFGYIMLAEVINAKRGLGALIIMSQRQGPREHIYLCLVIISVLAWGIDRLILLAQRHFFPYLKNAQT